MKSYKTALTDPNLTDRQFRLYCILLNEAEPIMISKEKMAEKLHTCNLTARATLYQLQQLGYVKYSSIYGKSSKKTYKVELDRKNLIVQPKSTIFILKVNN